MQSHLLHGSICLYRSRRVPAASSIVWRAYPWIALSRADHCWYDPERLHGLLARFYHRTLGIRTLTRTHSSGPVNATNSIAMGLAQPMARPSISLNHAPSLSPSSSSSSSSTPASIPPPPSPQPTSAVVWLAGDNNTFTINPRDSYGNRAVGFHDQPIRLHYRLLEFDSTCCTSAAHHCQWDDALLAPLNDATMPSPYDHVAVFEPYLRPSHPLDPFVPNPVTLQQGPFSMSLLSDGRVQVTANITTACVFYLHISIGDTSIMSRYVEPTVYCRRTASPLTTLTGTARS